MEIAVERTKILNKYKCMCWKPPLDENEPEKYRLPKIHTVLYYIIFGYWKYYNYSLVFGADSK